MTRNRSSCEDVHDDGLLMVPPAGYKFIPKSGTVCGKAGCFECFDIYCERCDSKDRRIVELEMRNNDLVKYITQLQGKIFANRSLVSSCQASSLPPAAGSSHANHSGTWNTQINPGITGDGCVEASPPLPSIGIGGEPFAYIQSPVLFDPTMNLSYIATTTFTPASQTYAVNHCRPGLLSRKAPLHEYQGS